jgi:hypothetical protein
MKSLFHLTIACAIILFYACSNEKHGKVTLDKKNKKLDYVLFPDSIYRTNSIKKALAIATPAQKAESRKFFMEGLDLFANKSNYAASVEFFREAVLYYPDEKNYSHLFNAYIQSGQTALADSVNNVLSETIDYTEGMYNRALIFALMKDTASCVSELHAAMAEGFAFKDRIINEKLFDFLKENPSYQSLIVTYFGNDEKMKKILFNSFVKSFPEISLPFEMPVDSVKSFNFDKYINYDYAMFIPGMDDGRFSRDVTREYMMVGKLKTESGYAVIYKSYEMIADTLNPVTTGIVTYDSLGAIIGNETIACFCSPLESRSFNIGKDMSINITNYKSKWESDPLEKGYAGNKIVSTDVTGRQKYFITKENTLKEEPVEQDIAASSK